MGLENNEKILDKIKKCLALSKSSNPHEAESALRQARKLMEMHQVEIGDVDASMAEEARMECNKRPPDWSRKLGVTCAEAFGCTLIVVRGYSNAEFRFVGVNGAPELATYAYDVLVRQLKQSRKAYVGTLPARCKLSTKRRKADIFADTWVRTVYSLIADFSGVDENVGKAINAFKNKHYPDLVLEPYKERKVSADDRKAQIAGYNAAKNAKLHKAMSADQRIRISKESHPEKLSHESENLLLF